ncbi:hypothetical protein D6851_16405 [Altericroceibacterium spongiae]|uniref:Uncharacterized protein n=1 Tax=Altericroceibacterium spongiae TaxID=2320269 RepID=A0A420EA96_9SPHN|nr:hypothetical protein [Altericroceibacterium spongiae]RKF17608.1 hypothetical protein D6851_16405 [Altericroceibacterium spongiae]
MRKLLPVAMMALCCTFQPVAAQPTLAFSEAAPADGLVWRGEERWALSLEDGESGVLRLGFVQTPAGDYLVSGEMLLQDAELGVTGSGRWRGNRLILDLTVLGGIRDVPPEPAKRGLYPEGQVPDLISSTGFAMMRAELERGTLDGRTAQYQTNIVTGNHLQGPILRLGRLERMGEP